MLTLYLAVIDDENDKQLFENIYNSYKKQMIALSCTLLHNELDAEEAVHDVFLRIATGNMDAIRKIKSDVDLRNYLLKAVKNTSLNMIKKRKHDNIISLDTVNEYELNRMQNLPSDIFVETICQKTEYDSIVNAIENLDEKYRYPLYYHFVVGLSVPEVAKSLNQAVSTTKKQLVRGKKMLMCLLGIKGDEYSGNKQ